MVAHKTNEAINIHSNAKKKKCEKREKENEIIFLFLLPMDGKRVNESKRETIGAREKGREKV